MKRIAAQASLADQAYYAILDEICDGSMPAGTHLIQDQLAKTLGVSRHPIQQAMAFLKADGLVEEAPGRGLRVTELDLESMLRHYEIRAALDGLAAGLTADRCAASPQDAQDLRKRGGAIIDAGMAAVAAGSIKRMVRCDVEFHHLIYAGSGNPLIAASAQTHWRQLRRMMGEILRNVEPPREIWRQHEEILSTVVEGVADKAEALAIRHIERATAALPVAFGTGSERPR